MSEENDNDDHNSYGPFCQKYLLGFYTAVKAFFPSYILESSEMTQNHTVRNNPTPPSSKPLKLYIDNIRSEITILFNIIFGTWSRFARVSK